MNSASAETYYSCTGLGVEQNGDRKAEVKFKVDPEGKVLSGQMNFTKVCKAKASSPGGDYQYAGGAKLTRNADPYEWVMDASWSGTNDTCDSSSSKNQGTVMIRKLKIQNVAEMQLKGKDGTVWYLFPHGCDCKQVSTE